MFFMVVPNNAVIPNVRLKTNGVVLVRTRQRCVKNPCNGTSCLPTRGLLVFFNLSRASHTKKQCGMLNNQCLVRCWKEVRTAAYTFILNSRHIAFYHAGYVAWRPKSNQFCITALHDQGMKQEPHILSDTGFQLLVVRMSYSTKLWSSG